MKQIDTTMLLQPEKCRKTLSKIKSGETNAVITGHHLDNLIAVMENYGIGLEDIRNTLEEIRSYKGFQIYNLSLGSRISAMRHMQQYKIDYNAALTYQSMLENGLDTVITHNQQLSRIQEITVEEPE